MAPQSPLSRLKNRPEAFQWKDDELVTLAEAIALVFPNGPLSVSGLRRAIKNGELATVVIGGKIYTTLKELRSMSTPIVTEKPVSKSQAAIIEAERLISERINETLANSPNRRKRLPTLRLRVPVQKG